MRKAIVLAALFTTGYLFTSAQIKKDAILLGGQVSYNSNSNAYWNITQPSQTNQKNNGGNFNITIGKAFKENAVTGIKLGYSTSKSENSYNGTSFYNAKANQFNLGLFCRKYKKLGGDFYFFGEGGLDYFKSKQTNTDVAGNNKTVVDGSSGNLSLSPGISYQVCKKLQLEILLPGIISAQYGNYKATPQTNNSKQEYFSINTNLNGSLLNSVGIGFRFVL